MFEPTTYAEGVVLVLMEDAGVEIDSADMVVKI
jgi:hypothetical protein